MIFLGCLYDRRIEDEVLHLSNVGLQNAVNTYQFKLIDGLNKNLKNPVNIINVLPVGTWPNSYKKIKLESKIWSYDGSNNQEIGSINIPILKQVTRFIKIKKALKSIDKNESIIIYSTYMPFLKATYKLPKSNNVTLIVTDLPEYYDLGKTNKIKRILREINNKLVYKYLERVDEFVLLTEYMKGPLKVGNRPYTVVEGLVSDIKIDHLEKNNTKKKIILYTGTLHYMFGIKRLLDAFKMIEHENYELWICGAGDAEKEIRELSKIDDRIKFFGYVTKKRIYELQQKSTILINPRTNEGEYTKYSFPSKTMEYMASGKPVLMYKLDGIPDEYDKYIYYIDDNYIETLKNRIIEVCEKSEEELYRFGLEARTFVMSEKNNIVQVKKIVDMIGINNC